MKSVLIVSLVLAVGCSSMKPGNYKMKSDSYQSREEIKDSFFQKKLTAEQVKTLLEQKLALPSDLKIAVVKLEHEWNLTTMADFQYQRNQQLIVSDENAKAIDDIKGKDKKIKEIAVVPQMLIPKDPTIENMREIAALMQADLLMVIKTRSQTDSKFRMFHKDQIKTVSTVEAMIIDVKTGVIPFTTIASDTIKLKENKDFSYEELYIKSSLKAEDKALSQVFRNVGEHFN